MSCTLHDVHEPQSASASITTSHCVRDLVAQVDRRRLRERRLREAARRAARARRAAPRAVEEHVAARLGDVEQADVRAVQRRRPRRTLAGRRAALARRIEQDLSVGSLTCGPPWSRAALPTSPLAQPPMMAENSPAPPPACTTSSPPARNFGSVALGERLRAVPRRCRPRRARPRRRGSGGSAASSSRSRAFDQPRVAEHASVLGRDHEHGVERRRPSSGGRRCAGTRRASWRASRRRAMSWSTIAAHALAREQRDRRLLRRRARARRGAAPTVSRPRPRRSRTCTCRGGRASRGRPRRVGRRRRCGSRAAARGRWWRWRGCPGRAR